MTNTHCNYGQLFTLQCNTALTLINLKIVGAIAMLCSKRYQSIGAWAAVSTNNKYITSNNNGAIENTIQKKKKKKMPFLKKL